MFRSASGWVGLTVVISLLLGGTCIGRAKPPQYPVTKSCIREASQNFNIPLRVLLGVLAVEDAEVGDAYRNPNGTVDYGPMQINSIWLDELKDQFSFTPSILTYDGCANVWGGSWILRRKIKPLDPETDTIWTAVKRYHSYTPRHQNDYVQSVWRTIEGRSNAELMEAQADG